MASTPTKKKYVSKGERPNVAKKNRAPNSTFRDKLISENHKLRVIAKPQNEKERELAKRYSNEIARDIACTKLISRFEKNGLTKAKAYHAYKTDKLAELEATYRDKNAAGNN